MKEAEMSGACRTQGGFLWENLNKKETGWKARA